MKELKEFIKAARAEAEKNYETDAVILDGDMESLAASINAKAGRFLVDEHLVTEKNTGNNTRFLAASESFENPISGSGMNRDELDAFIKDCRVPQEYVEACTIAVAGIIAKSVGCESNVAWNTHNTVASKSDNNMTFSDYADNLPLSSATELGLRASSEEFGIDMDKSIVDLKTAITVTVMSFHTRLTPRALASRPTADVAITYKREETVIMDLSKTSEESPDISLIQLYHNPDPVRNSLKPIRMLEANDGKDVLVDDEIARIGKTVNLLQLSIDKDKPGYGAINRTDTVDDSVHIKELLFSLTGGTTPATESFSMIVPSSISKFTRVLDGESDKRNCHFNHTILLENEAPRSNAAPSAIIDGMHADDRIAVTATIMGSCLLSTGDMKVLAELAYAAHNVQGNAPGPACLALVETFTTAIVTAYIPGAKFGEENVRKSNMAIKSKVDTINFAIPGGRNYVYDFPIGSSGGDRQAATLNDIIGIGQDIKVLDVILGTLDEVHDFNKLTNIPNPIISEREVGKRYVAGCKVKPFVYKAEINIEEIPNEKAADRPGDIKQYISTVLNAVITEVEEKSLYRQQLPDGSVPVYTLITSGKILGNVIGVPHIHNHLNTGVRRSEDGAEYVLVLDNGSILEVVTTTFEAIGNKIIIIPKVKGSKTSILNFGHNWDYGTLIAQYVSASGAAHQRLIANARELPIITNPIGAVISVEGVNEVNWLPSV